MNLGTGELACAKPIWLSDQAGAGWRSRPDSKPGAVPEEASTCGGVDKAASRLADVSSSALADKSAFRLVGLSYSLGVNKRSSRFVDKSGCLPVGEWALLLVDKSDVPPVAGSVALLLNIVVRVGQESGRGSWDALQHR